MEASNIKNIKKTTPGQFRLLVAARDEFPELVTARPMFGTSKADIEEKWSTVTNRINAVGPPVRNSSDWKRIWADMKCRTKMKISENAKAMKGTGGGPAVFNALTDIEKDIDRICHLSSAAAPSGVSIGVKSSTTTTSSTPIVLAVTPPRRSTNLAVVSPTSSEKLQSQFVSLLSPTPPSYDLTATTKVTSTPLAEKPYQKRPNKKRKLTDSREEEREEVKLLKRQVEQNNLLVEEMKAQTRSIESMADSLRGIHQVMNELLRHLRDE